MQAFVHLWLLNKTAGSRLLNFEDPDLFLHSWKKSTFYFNFYSSRKKRKINQLGIFSWHQLEGWKSHVIKQIKIYLLQQPHFRTIDRRIVLFRMIAPMMKHWRNELKLWATTCCILYLIALWKKTGAFLIWDFFLSFFFLSARLWYNSIRHPVTPKYILNHLWNNNDFLECFSNGNLTPFHLVLYCILRSIYLFWWIWMFFATTLVPHFFKIFMNNRKKKFQFRRLWTSLMRLIISLLIDS